MSSKVLDLLGDELVNKAGDKLKTSSIRGEGKVIAVYFSAHWCPPCRSFTPKLAEFYNKAKASANGSNYELVFVSSDKDLKAFDEYLSEMPWWALPYERRDEKAKLARHFKVSGIPTLVILDGDTGKVLNINGRATVDSDPEAKNFPWKAKTLYGILEEGEYMDNKEQSKSFDDDIKGKVLGIYFSAHWCPPCKIFTPELCNTYRKLNSETKKFEVVFVSSDQTETAFKDYFNQMPFLALPYDSPLKDELNEHFDINGIPTLIIVDEEGKVITSNGRSALSSDKEGKKFPWVPEAVEDVNAVSGSKLNEQACLIYFPGGDKECCEKMRDTMKPVALKVQAEAKQEDRDPDLCFMVANPDSTEIVSSLCKFIHLNADEKLLAIVDISSGKIYKSPQQEHKTEELEQFARDFIDGKLEGQNIRE